MTDWLKRLNARDVVPIDPVTQSDLATFWCVVRVNPFGTYLPIGLSGDGQLEDLKKSGVFFVLPCSSHREATLEARRLNTVARIQEM